MVIDAGVLQHDDVRPDFCVWTYHAVGEDRGSLADRGVGRDCRARVHDGDEALHGYMAARDDFGFFEETVDVSDAVDEPALAQLDGRRDRTQDGRTQYGGSPIARPVPAEAHELVRRVAPESGLCRKDRICDRQRIAPGAENHDARRSDGRACTLPHFVIAGDPSVSSATRAMLAKKRSVYCPSLPSSRLYNSWPRSPTWSRNSSSAI